MSSKTLFLNHILTDPDGRFAFAIPLFTICWGAGATSAAFITAEALLASLTGAVLGVIVYQGIQKLDQVANGETSEAEDKKKKNRDPNYPGSESDLEKNPDWKDTPHPDQRKAGHREFTNVKTGERIRYDKGDPKSAWT